jgi:hypothetical protein
MHGSKTGLVPGHGPGQSYPIMSLSAAAVTATPRRQPAPGSRVLTALPAWLALATLTSVPTPALAVGRSSANYQITVETLNSGGGSASSANYSIDSTLGEIGGTATSTTQTEIRAGFVGQLPSLISGRHIFYNESGWDSGNAAANAADDNAIAPDKVALLPGTKATLANYTSFSRGINGVMIDVTELSGTPTAADFQFKVGNNPTPSSWTAAPAPTTVAVRYGAGTGGSDRVTLLWDSGAITKKWLEIRVLPNLTTGLGARDVFYFGNAIGETGNNADVDANVNITDEVRIRDNPKTRINPASITFAFDINRDRSVNSTDQILARNNITTPISALRLITPAADPGAALASPSRSALVSHFEPAEPELPNPGADNTSSHLPSDADPFASLFPAVSTEAGGALPGETVARLGVLLAPGDQIALYARTRESEGLRLEMTDTEGRWIPAPVDTEEDLGGLRVWTMDPAKSGNSRLFRLAKDLDRVN